MRIFQITDLHIAKPGRETIDNIDVWGKFKAVLAKAKEMNPDLLVLSGDLCYESGMEETYIRIKKALDDSGLHYQVISGNHDDATLMSTIFDIPLNANTKESYYSKRYKEGQILFFDSTRRKMSDAQWKWFETQIDEQTIIFIHHPPVLVGTPFMDKNHSFLEYERMAILAQAKKKSLTFFCGHYHVERVVTTPNMNVYITPSTMVQIDGEKEDYTLGHELPGYRIIDWDGKTVRTYCEYLNL